MIYIIFKKIFVKIKILVLVLRYNKKINSIFKIDLILVLNKIIKIYKFFRFLLNF